MYTTDGSPHGDACAHCLWICRVVLCQDWQECNDKLEDPRDTSSRDTWNEIEENIKAQTEEEEQDKYPNPVRVPSAVRNSTGVTEMVSMELAFISEQQFLKYTGASVSTLKAELHDRISEDGMTMVRGVYVPFHGLPASMSVGDILSLRRVTLSYTRNISQDEMLLQAEKQVHKTQGLAVRKSACKALSARRAVSLPSLEKLSTLQAWAEKASAIENDRRNKEAEASGEKPEDAAGGVDKKRAVDLQLGSLDEPLPAPASTNKRRKGEPRSGAAKAKTAAGAARGQTRGISRDAREQSPTPSSAKKAKSLGGDVKEMSFAEALPGDYELQKVAERLGKVPDCFQALSPQRILAGEKLGRSLRAVQG